MYQMLLQVAAGSRFFATTAEVNITYTASVAAVARMTAPAVKGLMADIMVHLTVVAAVSESHSHPDMARLKPQPLVEALRIDAGVVREQFNQLAAFCLRLRNRPVHQLLADTAAAMA